MNIFASSSKPDESARYLDDKRVIKMVLESAQLLSTAAWLRGCRYPELYKPTHKAHPCTVWAAETRSNYLWLFEHYLALGTEYTARYGREHQSMRLALPLEAGAMFIPDGKLTPFVNCTDYKELPVHAAYQLQLMDKWDSDKREPTWYGVTYERD